MALINVSVKHGRTLEEVRPKMEDAVKEVRSKFGLMVRRVEWSQDRNSVKMFGGGAEVEMRADETEVHVTGDIPFLNKLLSGPVAAGIKNILARTVQKRLR